MENKPYFLANDNKYLSFVRKNIKKKKNLHRYMSGSSEKLAII